MRCRQNGGLTERHNTEQWKGVSSQYHIIKILDKYNIGRNLLTIYRLFTFIFILFFLFNEKRFSLHFRFVSYFHLLTIFILGFSPARTLHIQLHDWRTMVRKMRLLMTGIRTGCWGGFACPCFAVVTDDNDKDVDDIDEVGGAEWYVYTGWRWGKDLFFLQRARSIRWKWNKN